MILASALFLRCFNINQSLWWDEIWSTLEYAAAPSWRTTVGSLGYYFNNHPLYSLLCRASLALLGLSELSLRLPALVLGIAGVGACFVLRRYAGLTCAALTAALLAISSFHIDHSTEARGYSGLMLWAGLSSLFFLRALYRNQRADWCWCGVTTFLGCYTHVFMVAVTLTQITCLLLHWLGHAMAVPIIRRRVTAACRNGLTTFAATGLVTAIAYAPLLPEFIANLGKVRIVSVPRWPFLLELADTIYPGITTPAGLALYLPLIVIGAAALVRTCSRRGCPVVALYALLLPLLPLLLYLATNPMFVFTRYFIFALPACLLLPALGIATVARGVRLSPHAHTLFCLIMLAALCWIQLPAISTIVLHDRQNYREAVALAESLPGTARIITIGHAGPHFRFYAKQDIVVPETFAEFQRLVRTKPAVCCLVSAWLPELRPPHEDRQLYAELPEHERIYAYVRQHFTHIKTYATRFPTHVYRSQPAAPPAGV